MEYISSKDVKPFDFGGLKIRELTPRDLSEAPIAEIEVAAGCSHKRARSNKSGKINFCFQGAVSFRVEGQDVALENKDLLLFPKNEWFDYRNDNAEAARLFFVTHTPFDIEAEELAE